MTESDFELSKKDEIIVEQEWEHQQAEEYFKGVTDGWTSF